jgi:HD superfamily phosphohydrolase YqeK
MTKNDRIMQYKNLMGDIGIPVVKLDDIGFFDAPASVKYHGAYTGGLFDHSFLTAKALVELTEKLNLEWERPESPYIVGMYHDMCKCDNYRYDSESYKWMYNQDVIIPDHGAKSVITLQKFIALTDEEVACIRWHMGAYETDVKMWNYYGKAIEKYHNVLFTHTADMISSKIYGV